MKLALIPLLLLAGCCAGLELTLGAYDPRVELESQPRYALLAPVLSGQVWAYASTAAVASQLQAHYRPLRDAPTAIGALSEAEPELRAALEAADGELRALGYLPADQKADFVLLVGLTTFKGCLTRVSIDVGRELDGRFRPDLISLAGLVPNPDDDPCPVTAAEAVRELVGALPAYAPPE